MPRIARIVAIGLPHHITQRGNYRQEIFLDHNDKLRYLSWIQEYSKEYGLSILAYCLMQNHVHFIAIPNREDSLAKTFNSTHMRYSHYFNRRLKATGHLWQGRFYSCILDEAHLIVAAKYIERNPVRANMVKKPWHYKWSSAQAHISNEQSIIELGNLFKFIGMSYASWKEYLHSKEDQKASNDIRKHTLTGRPAGAVSFIEKLEKEFNRRLLPLPVGRPRNTKG